MNFNKKLEALKNYEAGKPIELVVREFGIKPEDVIKLASNENPYGSSPKVLEAVKNEAAKMALYPDDSMFELKEVLSKKYNLTSKNIIIGSGSDQIIEFCLHAKADEKSKILMAGVTFAMYEIYSKHVGANVVRTTSKKHDLKEMLDIYKKEKDISMVFLCLPNNPLGECPTKDEVYSFIKELSSDTLVVVDGAYQEFASFKDKNRHIEPKELIEKFPNAIYLGTFSKAYGLGGMRVGYGLANENIINALSKLRPPFNITTLSLKAAIVALNDEDFVQNTLKNNFIEMERYKNLAKEVNIEIIESFTNFITFILPKEKNSSKICQDLMKKGIIIRDLASYNMNAVRITIGTQIQNDRVLQTFKTLYM
ncbi:MAG: histidinol-phosphate transaminase [Campylobacteraceae bacterium]